MPCASIRLTYPASKIWNWPGENYSNSSNSNSNNNRIKTRKTPLKTKISLGKNPKIRVTTGSRHPHHKASSRPSNPNHRRIAAPVT